VCVNILYRGRSSWKNRDGCRGRGTGGGSPLRARVVANNSSSHNSLLRVILFAALIQEKHSLSSCSHYTWYRIARARYVKLVPIMSLFPVEIKQRRHARGSDRSNCVADAQTTLDRGSLGFNHFSNITCNKLNVAESFLRSLLPPSSGDGRGSKDLWNVRKLLPDYTALQPRRQPSS
jgi:hypothetical protein